MPHHALALKLAVLFEARPHLQIVAGYLVKWLSLFCEEHALVDHFFYKWTQEANQQFVLWDFVDYFTS